MQDRTEIVGVSLMDRLMQLIRTHQTLLRHIASVLAGYVMASSYILTGLSPFGVAFVAAIPGGYSITTAAGAVLGYTFSPMPGMSMKYIVAVVMVLIARWLFERGANPKYRTAICSVISMLCLVVPTSAVLIVGSATMYDAVIAVAELLLACGATYFFARAISTLRSDLSRASRSDISCLVIAFCVVLMGLSAIQIFGYSLGRIVGAVTVLVCARYAREAGGAISGITAGIALGLAGGDYSYLLATYGFGGLMCGVFGGMGRIAVAASFIFVNTLTALFTMNYTAVYSSVFEIFIASVIFVAIPHKWVPRLEFLRQGAVRPDVAAQKALCERIEDISGALKEICTTTQQVSARLGQIESVDHTTVYTRTAEQVCGRCGMKTSCWQFRYSDTVDSMNKCLDILRRDGNIDRKDMPKRFADSCCKLDEFVAALNTRFHDYVSKEGVQRKVSKVRAVVTDQFEGIALMLDEIAGELGEMRLLEPAKAKQVGDYFEKEGLTPQQVLCFTDEYDRMSVELQIPNYQAAKLHKSKSALDLGALLDADFDLPQITPRQKYTSVLYAEKACLTVELGAYQIAAGNGRLCGDAYDFIRNKGGKTHFILSDGMGSGGSAAVDSAMASGLIARLISVGIGYEAALKIVNSALLIKSGEESLATIDICSLDLFTGKADFYKAGAAPTYVVKGGKAGYVESTSLPAGILRGVAFEKSGLTLHEGDLVVMVSDGVIVTGSDWVKSDLESASAQGMDVQRLCEKLATTAKMRRADGREDDITVIGALVQRGA